MVAFAVSQPEDVDVNEIVFSANFSGAVTRHAHHHSRCTRITTFHRSRHAQEKIQISSSWEN